MKICTRCVMDETASGITFNEIGICNYCEELNSRLKNSTQPSETNLSLTELLSTIKKSGAKKKYDCIIGLSGGVDSAWTLHLAVKNGLRPLAVHMDNGWNSELAVNNIKNLVSALDVDLYTHVINWQEYRNLMLSFFEADVVDVELLYDNAMTAVNYQLAAKYGIKWILAGTNTSTEGIMIPRNFNWFKFDSLNITSIHTAHKNTPAKSFPFFGVNSLLYYKLVKKISWVSFLDYTDFVKEEALSYMETNYKYKRYAYKHYESIFTRFYQGYILPQKFGIDKRIVHLSSLIISGQETREKALEILQEEPYPNSQDLHLDKIYFLKKMEWQEDDLEKYIRRKPRPHDAYKSELGKWKKLKKIHNFFKKL